MASEEYTKEELLPSRNMECVRERVKDDSRFPTCIKGRIMIPCIEIRKMREGGDLGEEDQEFGLGCTKGSYRHIKWFFVWSQLLLCGIPSSNLQENFPDYSISESIPSAMSLSPSPSFLSSQ